MLVRFLCARTFKAHCFTYPIRVFAEQLKQIGITVKFHYTPDVSLAACDVLCLSSETFRRTLTNRTCPDRYDVLRHYRQQVQTLIWFDTTASTGTTQFSVLPYVDLYAKNQLLRERSFYTRPFYNNRYFTDYYHRRNGIVDMHESDPRLPARPGQLEKLAVSWNLGLGDYHTFTKWGRRLRAFWPGVNYCFQVTPSQAARDVDVSYRVATHSSQATVAYQREETHRQLAELAAKDIYIIVHAGKLPYRQYQDEIRRTGVMPSPFGLGEFCFRDIECFLAGAALLKPDMSHLETWPDYYEPGVTYIPHAWDFSDFQDKLVELLEDTDLRLRIAASGQNRYLDSVSPAGGEAFARHFAALVQRATENAQG